MSGGSATRSGVLVLVLVAPPHDPDAARAPVGRARSPRRAPARDARSARPCLLVPCFQRRPSLPPAARPTHEKRAPAPLPLDSSSERKPTRRPPPSCVMWPVSCGLVSCVLWSCAVRLASRILCRCYRRNRSSTSRRRTANTCGSSRRKSSTRTRPRTATSCAARPRTLVTRSRTCRASSSDASSSSARTTGAAATAAAATGGAAAGPRASRRPRRCRPPRSSCAACERCGFENQTTLERGWWWRTRILALRNTGV